MKTTPERTRNPGQKSRLDERFSAARVQLQLRIKKRAWTRRTPPRAQLRVQAQLRAHAHRLAQIQQQGLRETDPRTQVESNDQLEKVWGLVSQVVEPFESVNEDSAWRVEERNEALIRQAAEEEARLRGEEVAREQATAAQARAKEMEWINQEAKDSILILAGMGERPIRSLATGYVQMLHDGYVRRLVERTDDLLEYLWDKTHSGDWICPEIKEAIDLDRLLGLVLQREAQGSYFPSATQDLAASLLRKWRGEDRVDTDGSALPAAEATSPTVPSLRALTEIARAKIVKLKDSYPVPARSVSVQPMCQEKRALLTTLQQQSIHKPLSGNDRLLHRTHTSHHLLR